MNSLRAMFLGLLYSMIFHSCGDGNYQNVRVTGVIVDHSNVPIPKAQVLARCWQFSSETWDSKFIEKQTLTDENGVYELQFDKSEAIDFFISAEGFKQMEQSITLRRSKVVLDFSLKKD